MKDAPRQQFRNAAHVSGAANVKPKDYEPAAEVEAESEYAAWALLRATEQPLSVGDLLELTDTASAGTGLRICKYVGFEEARSIVPEPIQASLPGQLSAPGLPSAEPPPQDSAQA